jgi:uncharacterized membrane protein YeiH
MSATTLLLVLDLVGIAVFGVSGALTGVGKSLDLFGVLFLSIATALGGGFLRDALIGATPAAALNDWRYLVVPLVVGLIAFYVHPTMTRLTRVFLLVDAAGLGLFAVAGTRKALDFGVPAVGACGIGLLTSIGGGLIRDVLVREIPTVLHREIYATAGLLAAAIVVVGDKADFNNVATAAVAIASAFLLRVVSRWKQWSAPVPRIAD